MTMTARRPAPGVNARLAALQDQHERAAAFARDLAAMEAREHDPDRAAALRERRRELEHRAARLEIAIAEFEG